MASRYSDDELTANLMKPGWHRTTSSGAQQTGTLQEMATAAHADRATHPGVVKQIETAVELELIQLQKLWEHLGLPERLTSFQEGTLLSIADAKVIVALIWASAISFLLGWRYREAIVKILMNGLRGKVAGMEIDIPRQNGPIIDKEVTENSLLISDPAVKKAIEDRPIVQKEADRIRSVFNDKGGIETNTEVLVLILAEANLNVENERTYRLIYGSQNKALQWLITAATQPIERLKSFYDAAATAWPTEYAHISFETWWGFLQRANLITFTAPSQIRATDRALDYFHYLASADATLEKPY